MTTPLTDSSTSLGVVKVVEVKVSGSRSEVEDPSGLAEKIVAWATSCWFESASVPGGVFHIPVLNK